MVFCATIDGAVVKRMILHKPHSVNRNPPYGEKSDDDKVKIIGTVLGEVDLADFAEEKDIPALEEPHGRETLDF